MEAIVNLLRSFLDACGPTQHLLGNVLIEVQGDRASSRAYVSDMHLGSGVTEGQTFSTLGDYHDEWRLVGWVLAPAASLQVQPGSRGVLRGARSGARTLAPLSALAGYR